MCNIWFLSKAQQKLHSASPLTEYAQCLTRFCFMQIQAKVFHLSLMEKMILGLSYKNLIV